MSAANAYERRRGRLRRPRRPRRLRRPAPVPVGLLAPVHLRGGDPPHRGRPRLSAGRARDRDPGGPEQGLGDAARAPTSSSPSATSTSPSPDSAVLNCITGFDTHRNPYFSAAVSAALNDWVRETFLEHDDRLRASVSVSPVSPDDATAESASASATTRASSRCCSRCAATCRGATRTTTRCSRPPASARSRWRCTRGGGRANR